MNIQGANLFSVVVIGAILACCVIAAAALGALAFWLTTRNSQGGPPDAS